MNIQLALKETALGVELPSYIAADYQHFDKPIGIAKELMTVLFEWRNAAIHYALPMSRQLEDTNEKFRELANTWKKDVRLYSSVSQMVLHPAYQRIVGMGPAAVPLLLRELAEKPDHWFWALKAITGVDPVKLEHRGKVRQMAEDWLRWGQEQGYRR
jgi:hypothetical protein